MVPYTAWAILKLGFSAFVVWSVADTLRFLAEIDTSVEDISANPRNMVRISKWLGHSSTGEEVRGKSRFLCVFADHAVCVFKLVRQDL